MKIGFLFNKLSSNKNGFVVILSLHNEILNIHIALKAKASNTHDFFLYFNIKKRKNPDHKSQLINGSCCIKHH